MRSLLESIRQVISLNEVTLDNVALGYPNGFDTSHEVGHTNLKTSTPDILQHLNQADPTAGRTNEYTNWLARQYAGKKIRQEDTDRAKTALARLHNLKIRKKLPGFDINKHDLSSVEDEIGKHADVAEKSNKQQIKDIKSTGADLIHQENGLTVHKITTHEAAKIYGEGTKWCTTNQSHACHYLGYKDKGTEQPEPPDEKDVKPLYVVKNKDGKRYQIHFETGQAKDEADREVDRAKLIKENPELMHVKEFQDKSSTFDPDSDRVDERVRSPDANKGYVREAIKSGRVKADTLHHLVANSSGEPEDGSGEPEDGSYDSEIAEQKIPEKTQELLADRHMGGDLYHHRNVQQGLIRNPSTTSGVLSKLYRGISTKEYRAEILTHKNVPEDITSKVAMDKSGIFHHRVLAAKHPNTSEATIRKIHDDHPAMDGALSVNPNTPSDLLDELSQDTRSHVRANVASHKKTSRSTLERLLSDDSEDVGAAAKKTLSKMKVAK